MKVEDSINPPYCESYYKSSRLKSNKQEKKKFGRTRDSESGFRKGRDGNNFREYSNHVRCAKNKRIATKRHQRETGKSRERHQIET